MTPPANPERYKNHRFPGAIIRHGVWLYYRPPCPAYYRVAKLVQRVRKTLGVTPCLGLRVPVLLQRAGFQVRQVQVLLHTNVGVEEQFMEYLKLCIGTLHESAPALVNAAETRRLQAELDVFLARYRGRWCGVYPQVLAVGEKV